MNCVENQLHILNCYFILTAYVFIVSNNGLLVVRIVQMKGTTYYLQRAKRDFKDVFRESNDIGAHLHVFL